MEEIKSPYIEEVKFDYNKLRTETTLPAVKQVYQVLADNVDLLVYNETATVESITESLEVVAQKVLTVLAENKVPNSDMQFVITLIQDSIYAIFNSISKRKDRLENEFMARTIGARDPGTGKLSREFATFADFFAALEKIRKEQDIEGNQYFIVKDEPKS